MSILPLTTSRENRMRNRLLTSLCLSLIGLFVLVFVPQNKMYPLRQSVLEFLLPVYELASYPARRLAHIRIVVQNQKLLEDKVTRLSQANEGFEKIADELAYYKLLSERYAALLSLPVDIHARMIGARVVADLKSPFVHTLLANVGSIDGVMTGQIILGNRGIIGRVIAVGKRSSRILLLTDLNSHLPVVVGRQRGRAIMTGDNTPQPILEFFDKDDKFENGDNVVTSGDRGVLPMGLRVGKVVIGDDDALRVRLHQDFARIDFVRIILTDMPAPPENAIDLPRRLQNR